MFNPRTLYGNSKSIAWDQEQRTEKKIIKPIKSNERAVSSKSWNVVRITIQRGWESNVINNIDKKEESPGAIQRRNSNKFTCITEKQHQIIIETSSQISWHVYSLNKIIKHIMNDRNGILTKFKSQVNQWHKHFNEAIDIILKEKDVLNASLATRSRTNLIKIIELENSRRFMDWINGIRSSNDIVMFYRSIVIDNLEKLKWNRMMDKRIYRNDQNISKVFLAKTIHKKMT